MATRKRNKSIEMERAPASSTGFEAEETTSTTQSDSSAEAPSREELIRREAYAIYERRGFATGDETADWVEAEREVDRRLGSPG